MVYGVVLGPDFDFWVRWVVRSRGHEIQVNEILGQGQTSNYIWAHISMMKQDIRANPYIIRKRKEQGTRCQNIWPSKVNFCQVDLVTYFKGQGQNTFASFKYFIIYTQVRSFSGQHACKFSRWIRNSMGVNRGHMSWPDTPYKRSPTLYWQ